MGPHGPVPDPDRLLSGHPADAPVPAVDPQAAKDCILFTPDLTTFVGPWGTSFSANLTSDETGIGNWTEAQFLTALIKGTSPDGRHYYPAFPYTSYQRARFDDLRDEFAYIKTLPQVPGRIRDHDREPPVVGTRLGLRRVHRGLGLLERDRRNHGLGRATASSLRCRRHVADQGERRHRDQESTTSHRFHPAPYVWMSSELKDHKI